MSKSDIRHDILKSELGNQMLDMVAPIYDDSEITLHLFEAFGEKWEPITDFVINDFIAQIFPQTATWGLDYWEEQYGIPIDHSKTIEERRAYFMSLKFNRPPMIPKRVESIVTSLTGLKCTVDDTVAPNTFSVTTYGGYPKDLKGLCDVLDSKTPAHLIYTIKGIETIETTTDIFPFVVGKRNHTERLGAIGVSPYVAGVERIEVTITSVFQAMASGNVAETMGEIEVI